ncbi:hypothetical protein Desac_0081 [Desulfobacca acetoxidans DSM 11109]|uniref:Uncharacterized protein n=1 Tax=Desulfobacca acetoxidans (strain ATCC 700848 / DSM 11109 / ASRB2) TaxID=880072 RepID=F2NJ21_DESAR|nr:hypothetical protein Desac_0081 [Desulfobacca acetoxidans DSM 11109]
MDIVIPTLPKLLRLIFYSHYMVKGFNPLKLHKPMANFENMRCQYNIFIVHYYLDI